MSFTKDSATERAIGDLSKRIGVERSAIKPDVADADFPNTALGATTSGEMAAQMISSGWRIKLAAGGKNYEYRADKYQLRLVGFGGSNLIIES